MLSIVISNSRDFLSVGGTRIFFEDCIKFRFGIGHLCYNTYWHRFGVAYWSPNATAVEYGIIQKGWKKMGSIVIVPISPISGRVGHTDIF
jgi:hypothetical protein